MISNAHSLVRSLLIYGVCLPLAIFLGYLIADPLTRTTFTTVGIVLFVLTIPLFLRWHHVWLIAIWNASFTLFFLPGTPNLSLFLSVLSCLIAVGQYTLNRRMKFLQAPTVTKPLIFITAVVWVTAQLTGGIGLRVMGSASYGGMRYVSLTCAVLGYFALISQQVPPHKRLLYVGLFFLGVLTMAIGSLAPYVPSFMYPIFLFIPPEMGDTSTGDPNTITITRLGAVEVVATALIFVMLARYGIREIFTWRRPWRLMWFLFFLCICPFGGFRSGLLLMVVTFAIVFYLEGLMRSRLLPIFIFWLLLGGVLLVPFSDRLPLSVQRTLSFLPLRLDPIAKNSAEDSSDWRLTMWKHVAPQIPEYLIIGKGYSFNASDLAMMTSFQSENRTDTFELSGTYHNGPLSVIIPFGIFGCIGFIWFLVAAIRVFHSNYYYGDPACRHINALLLAYFIAKTIIFLVVYGSFYSDLASFTGLVGLSISLNGGVAKPAAVPQPIPVLNRYRLPPAGRKAAGAN
jgi:hypothetical protein